MLIRTGSGCDDDSNYFNKQGEMLGPFPITWSEGDFFCGVSPDGDATDVPTTNNVGGDADDESRAPLISKTP